MTKIVPVGPMSRGGIKIVDDSGHVNINTQAKGETAKDNKGKTYTVGEDGKIYRPDGTPLNLKKIKSYRDFIRPLDQHEREMYSAAITDAVSMILPSFRDALSLLRPFFDLTATTAYTDKYARVGLGIWFFSSELNARDRAVVLIHESMHVLNDHFVRADNYGEGVDAKLINIAGDFEINNAIDTLPNVSVKWGIFPDKKPFDFPPNLLMEEYLPMLLEKQKEAEKCKECGGTGQVDDTQEDSDDTSEGQGSEDQEGADGGGSDSEQGEDSGEDQGGSGSGGQDESDGQDEGDGQDDGEGGGTKECPACQGTGKNQGEGESQGQGGMPQACGTSNDAREEAADDAGVERASEAEKQISKRNTQVRVNEELEAARRAGSGHLENFYGRIAQILAPPKVDWRTLFRQIVSANVDIATRGRQDYSYKRVNRRFANSKYIFPGMIQYEPTVMFGVDTSGSMGESDYVSTLMEIEGIVKNILRGKNKLKVFTVDTEISNVQIVSSAKDLDLVGGGGTRMATAFEYLNTLKRREFPDVFVLATDAGLYGGDWEEIIEAIKNAPRKFTPIILVTHKYGFEQAPEHIHQYAKVLDISEE